MKNLKVRSLGARNKLNQVDQNLLTMDFPKSLMRMQVQNRQTLKSKIKALSQQVKSLVLKLKIMLDFGNPCLGILEDLNFRMKKLQMNFFL